MTWKENPSVFLWVRIQGCVFPPPHKGHWQVAFSKVSGVLGTSAAAVKKWQIRGCNVLHAVVGWYPSCSTACCRTCPCWAPTSSWVPFVESCLESDRPRFLKLILSREKHSQKLLWRLVLGSWIQTTSRIHGGTWMPWQSKEVPGSKLGPKTDVRNHYTNEVLLRLLEYENTACQKIYRNDKSNLLKSYDISRVQKQDIKLEQSFCPKQKIHIA